jgi:hypothetical protein
MQEGEAELTRRSCEWRAAGREENEKGNLRFPEIVFEFFFIFRSKRKR